MYMAQKLCIYLHISAQVQEERPDWGQMEALNLVNNIQDPILVNAAQDLSSSNTNNNQDTPIRYTALYKCFKKIEFQHTKLHFILYIFG